MKKVVLIVFVFTFLSCAKDEYTTVVDDSNFNGITTELDQQLLAAISIASDGLGTVFIFYRMKQTYQVFLKTH